ncbi:BlaI/MecI/CopY family transcriptional regulator [Streptomyces sp. NBC_01727]|uniref:BlaI/MecI/CopY family transcriptional regulator n=1 Tax=unclassified Streptomyces TaxID=2593676 RepID=UPI002E0F19E2|nr:BlaI/MecI/CopY family transcriptional regulator [Streptomyces sp. NBC_01727]
MPGTQGRPHGELVADVLAILWAAEEPLTPQQINAALRHLARTTVTTILTRLHEKGTLVRTRAGRGCAYTAADDAAGLAAGRMRRELEREPHRDLVLKRFAHIDLYRSRRANPDISVKESFGAVRKSSGRP